MKTKLLAIALLFVVGSFVPVSAAVTVDQAISKEYIMNNGYSELTSDTVTVAKHRSTGNEYYTQGEQRYRNSNGFCKFFRNLFNYTDPAAEDYSFFHHNVKPAPEYTDF